MTFNQPPGSPQRPVEGMQCPKCRGTMRSYERNGVLLEQCDNCRGVFLDFGELEHLVQLEGRYAAPQQPYPPQQQYPPRQYAPGYGPTWGMHHGHGKRKGIASLFFSS